MSCLLKASLYFTAAGICAYWGAVFSGAFPVIELVPGYRSWFMSFPIPDFWIAITSLLAVVLARFDKRLSAIAMAAAGSGLVFLGLYAFAYGFNSGLVYELTVDELIEIAIKIYCLTMGAWLLVSAYRQIPGPRKAAPYPPLTAAR
ncbi:MULTISPECIES: hypothetical protein [unclassified Bradyrhizobium]|uniref:hypothetical protein n=1 Tax=unclassified Bradyrhizobium TaxID=2631580 RepID=UPI0028EA1B14|nr:MULTISPECIES: hypothetical protein [unclassified Bradyrhizobium]